MTLNLNRVLLMALIALTSCATLDTRAMSSGCRDAYNRCLNRCPMGSNRVAPGADLAALSRSNIGTDLQIDTAACTKGCNDDQKTCK